MAERKPPKPVSAASLEASALYYLERFASSSGNLRQVLLRRVRRSAEAHGTDPAEGAKLVDALILRFLESGLLDDRAYAEARSASLHRRGTSSRGIAAKLAAKGVGRALIGAVLEEDEARPGGDLAAAAALARRRRLGPYRLPETREAYRLKDFGALARAGFGRSIADKVLDAADPAALDALLAEEA